MGVGSLVGFAEFLRWHLESNQRTVPGTQKKKKKKVTLGPKELRLYSVLQSKKKNLFNVIY